MYMKIDICMYIYLYKCECIYEYKVIYTNVKDIIWHIKFNNFYTHKWN